MQFVRPAFATYQRRFGRAPRPMLGQPASRQADLSADLRLFATTFAAGFLFVSILIG
ncbi:hypothetical protein [Sphingomonas sp.]|uniref:hypothetical protein n=1 Tax=Sphingomonas sp. TaxID=28214 RepID=UPI0038A68322